MPLPEAERQSELGRITEAERQRERDLLDRIDQVWRLQPVRDDTAENTSRIRVGAHELAGVVPDGYIGQGEVAVTGRSDNRAREELLKVVDAARGESVTVPTELLRAALA